MTAMAANMKTMASRGGEIEAQAGAAASSATSASQLSGTPASSQASTDAIESLARPISPVAAAPANIQVKTGAAARLAGKATSERRSKCRAMTGRVARQATKLMRTKSRITRRPLPPA